MDKNTVGLDESLPFIEEAIRKEVEDAFLWYRQQALLIAHPLAELMNETARILKQKSCHDLSLQ